MLSSTTYPRPSGSRLLGFGAAQPGTVVDGGRLGERFGKDAEWVAARTGIRTVRRIGDGDRQSSGIERLATDAANAALAASELSGDDIDLVITASCSVPATPTETMSLAASIAQQAPRLHLNAACSGFCYALSLADAHIRAGSARRVLIVAAEHMSRFLDPEDLGTSIIFGDGAGAAVVGAVEAGAPGIGPAVWGSDGSGAGLIACDPVPYGRLRMVGQQVFRWAIERMPAVALEACRRAGVGAGDIEVFVPHQANLRIVDAVARAAGLTRALVADDIVASGNTSAASIPIALARLVERRRVHSGQLALLLGFGAGLSYAGQVVILP